MKRTIETTLTAVVAFLGLIWGVFLVALVLPVSLNSFGVTPRTLVGLVGILAMPFLHGGLWHVLSNTMPLFVLLSLLAFSKARAWEIVATVILLSGLLLWLFGRSATHIGASGLVSGLIVFLIASGLLEKKLVPILISMMVGSLYGGSLLWGLVPQFGTQVSWEGHLCGAIAGGIVAYVLAEGKGPQNRSGWRANRPFRSNVPSLPKQPLV